MASDLLSIAASGARAARGALDVTAQNIANASSDGYVRRSAHIEEVSASGGLLRTGDRSLSGARISGIHRNADMFRQAEVRRTASDLQRSSVDLNGLQNLETAVEQAGIYDAVVEFEASLQQLTGDPTDSALRASVMGAADAMTQKFGIAANSIDIASEGLRFDAQAQVDQANVLGGEIARVNLRLARAGAGSSDRASLLDQRDLLLEKLSGIADINTSFSPDGGVTVKLGGSSGPVFVAGGNNGTMSMTTAADGTVSYQHNGDDVTISGGSLAGAASALVTAADLSTKLDALADGIAAEVNAAQVNGSDLNGDAGVAMFSGSGAAGMALAFTDGTKIAAAAAGEPAGSRDSSNLGALQLAFAGSKPAQQTNMLLFDISSRVSARELTHEALDTIAASARISLEQQAGVDLDTEAANLVRFQQAFQASGRAMQVASDIFDTLIGIG